VVRGRDERKKLRGFDCYECEEYYKSKLEEGYSEEQVQKMMNDCSKHRGKYKPPLTPEKFWDPEMIEGDPESPRNKTQVQTKPFNNRARRRALNKEKNKVRKLEKGNEDNDDLTEQNRKEIIPKESTCRDDNGNDFESPNLLLQNSTFVDDSNRDFESLNLLTKTKNQTNRDKEMEEMEEVLKLSIETFELEKKQRATSSNEASSSSPNYAHVHGVVRMRDARKKLCYECQENYKSKLEEGYSEEEVQKMMNDCSKHRGKYKPLRTPEKLS